MKSADVLIIGGGLMGFSTALQMAMRGIRCTVLEKDSPGRHASGVNAGGLRQLNRHPAEIPLSVAAAEMWHNIYDLVGSDCDTRFPGQIRVAENSADMLILEDRAAMVQGLGFDHEEVIGAEELYRLVPALTARCKGGLISRKDGYGRPFHALNAFRRKACALGTEFHSSTRVDELDYSTGEWTAVTPNGEFRAPVLVNCAGAWASRIAAAIGDTAPVKPGAPMLMITERLPRFMDQVIGAASRKLSFKQMQNGTVLIGGAHMAELDFVHQTTDMNWAKLAVSARTVMALFPQLENVRIIRTWAGIEAFMPDNLPVISPSEASADAYHAFGFSAHGFQLSPVVGKIISQLILDGRTDYPIESFRIERFRNSQ